MNALNIDWDKFVNWFLETFSRKARQRAWLRVLLTALVDLFGLLAQVRQDYIDELSINILTDVIQDKLRVDYPDIGSFRCYVINQWDTLPQTYNQFIGEHHKQQFTYFLNESSYSAEYGRYISERTLPHDYEVIIPVGHNAAQSQIEAFLDKFRPAGKRYKLTFQNI